MHPIQQVSISYSWRSISGSSDEESLPKKRHSMIGGLLDGLLHRYLGLAVLPTCTAVLLVACGGNGTLLPPPSVAELAVSTDEASEVVLGVPASGVVDDLGDSDVFVFDVDEGVFYEINVHLGTLEFPMVDVLNSDGVWLVGNDYYGGLDSRVVWRAESSGRSSVSVAGDDDTGSYELLVSEFVDDHANRIEEATVVALGVPVSGAVEYFGGWDGSNGDRDAFMFKAEEGVLYDIDVELGTLELPIIDVFDGDGVWLVGNIVSLYSEGRSSRVVWEAESSDWHFVLVAGYDTGSYELLVSEFVDDHGDLIEEATVTGLGVPVSGVVDHDGDSDVVVFEAEKGAVYNIDVDLGTLEIAHIDVFDGDGVWLVGNVVSPYGEGSSRVVWEAESSGQYFVVVSGSGGSSGRTIGTYELVVVIDRSVRHCGGVFGYCGS
jgi:hypothetical protein